MCLLLHTCFVLLNRCVAKYLISLGPALLKCRLMTRHTKITIRYARTCTSVLRRGIRRKSHATLEECILTS
ncbi:hypothetical protein F4809DRAFT_588660 [Biscogniauxia mediterranea]|nr:hypothetical protein F4809DRAFT_588660 [Biscogniauxia mediterranea]